MDRIYLSKPAADELRRQLEERHVRLHAKKVPCPACGGTGTEQDPFFGPFTPGWCSWCGGTGETTPQSARDYRQSRGLDDEKDGES